jgi:glycosyltransferase involved in cell wall biosynthesis
LSGYKGVDVLLEAMRLLQADRAVASLKVHGANLELQDGEFRRTVARLLEETRDTVTLVGKYRPEQLPELMRDIDWVIVPSIWWENSPLVIQEAFLNQRPVICSGVGGMAEKVTDGVNGIHFRVGDPVSLAAAIRAAVQSEGAWEEMRRGIPPIYRLDTQVAELQATYRDLVEKHATTERMHAQIN